MIKQTVKFGMKVSGHFTLHKGKADALGNPIPGTRQKVAEFDNIITNTGLDHLGQTPSFLENCHVGSGTATEAATDTALGSWIAYTSSPPLGGSNYQSTEGTAPYFSKQVIDAYRFDAGEATGTIAEVGIGPNTTNTALFSRARVKDGVGSPTTITVLADEYLDVTYEFRIYPDHVNSNGSTNDGTGSIDISATTYNYTIRPAQVTGNSYYDCNAVIDVLAVGVNDAIAYSDDAALGAVTGSPSATENDGASSTGSSGKGTYTPGNYYCDLNFVFALDEANFTSGSGGIKAVQVHSTMGAYQILFDSAIPKDNTEILTLPVRFAWARATIT